MATCTPHSRHREHGSAARCLVPAGIEPEASVRPRSVARGPPRTPLGAEPDLARADPLPPGPGRQTRGARRAEPAREPRARDAPLTLLTVAAQRPGSGTAPTAARAQHNRHSAARSSGNPASGRRRAAAILTRKPPGLGMPVRRPHLCRSAWRRRGLESREQNSAGQQLEMEPERGKGRGRSHREGGARGGGVRVRAGRRGQELG